MPDREEKGTPEWPPLSADICDQAEEGSIYICWKKKLQWMGGVEDEEGQKDNFVLYHETCNFTLT